MHNHLPSVVADAIAGPVLAPRTHPGETDTDFRSEEHALADRQPETRAAVHVDAPLRDPPELGARRIGVVLVVGNALLVPRQAGSDDRGE